MSETAMLKTARILSDIVYGIGAAIVITLFGITLFGSDQPANPDAMIPASPKELAFIWLAIGTILMLPACMAVYKFNVIKNSPNRKRKFVLIFLPGFICSTCALIIIGRVIFVVIDWLVH